MKSGLIGHCNLNVSHFQKYAFFQTLKSTVWQIAAAISFSQKSQNRWPIKLLRRKIGFEKMTSTPIDRRRKFSYGKSGISWPIYHKFQDRKIRIIEITFGWFFVVIISLLFFFMGKRIGAKLL